MGKEGRLVLGGQDGILLAAVDHLRDNRQAALVGCFGRSFAMTGSVRAFRGIEFAIRRATDIVSGAVVDFAKHGVNRGNRNNLHVKFRFLC